MAVNLFTSAGQPSDSNGNAGDMNWDSTNRILWGPKTSGGTWVGTGNSVQGPAGYGVITGQGAPGSTQGQNGQGYIDMAAGNSYLKSSNAWSQVGSFIGPTGQGTSNLGSLTAGYGPLATISSQALTSSNTSLAGSQFTPVASSAFIGAQFNTNATTAVVFTLYDVTASSPVYSYSLAANGQATVGPFPVATYPLLSTHQYQWLANTATSQTAAVQVMPLYAMPSSTPNQAISVVQSLGYSTSTSITTTAATIPTFGTTYVANYTPVRQGGLNYIQATMTAQGSTATSSTASLTGYYFSGSNSPSALSVGTLTLTADGVTRTLVSQTDTSTFATGYKFFWQVKSSATISVTLQVNVLGLI